MTKTVLDIHGEECFFNENDTVCEGHTYIDINKKICRIMQTNPQPYQLHRITSYSSFLDDPHLGQISAANPLSTYRKMEGDSSGQRFSNLKMVRKTDLIQQQEA